MNFVKNKEKKRSGAAGQPRAAAILGLWGGGHGSAYMGLEATTQVPRFPRGRGGGGAGVRSPAAAGLCLGGRGGMGEGRGGALPHRRARARVAPVLRAEQLQMSFDAAEPRPGQTRIGTEAGLGGGLKRGGGGGLTLLLCQRD